MKNNLKHISIVVSGMFILSAQQAHAFQSSMLECGFKFIVPPMILGVIFTIVAIVLTFVIGLSKRKKKLMKILLWWLVPIVCVVLTVIGSSICTVH